eukprot:g2465.t1
MSRAHPPQPHATGVLSGTAPASASSAPHPFIPPVPTGQQPYALSCECAHGVKIEVDWLPDDDVTASLWLDFVFHSTCQNPFSTSLQNKWMEFPLRVKELPLSSKIHFHVVRENGGIYEAWLHLFQPNGVLKQGRQVLILRNPPPIEEEDVSMSNATSANASPFQNQDERELLKWDKLLDLADRGLLAEGGGFSREHIQNLADAARKKVSKELLVVHLPCFTHPVIWSEVPYLDSVAARHMFANSATAGSAGPGLVQLDDQGFSFLNDQLNPWSSSCTVEPWTLDLMEVLGDTFYPENVPGKQGTQFVILVDHELESGFEHPAHLKYLKAQKSEQKAGLGPLGDRDGSQRAILRPNSEELTKLNDIVRRPKRAYSLEEKLLLYKFRYSLMDKKEALVKFLLVVDWADAEEKKHALELMTAWQKVDREEALALLSKDFRGVAEVRRYAVDRLADAAEEELLGYLLQLVQALRYVSSGTNQREGGKATGDEDGGVAEGQNAGGPSPGTGGGASGGASQKDDGEGARGGGREASSGRRKSSAFDTGETDPLLTFLIHRAQQNVVLATYFHWFLIAEIEASDSGQFREGEANLFSAYIFVKARQQLLDSLEEQQPKFARMITDQITFRRKLLWAMRVAKAQKRQSIELKIAKFQDALAGKAVPDADAGDRMIAKNFNVLDLPTIVDPSKKLVRIVPSKCFLIKSAMYPAVLHCEVKQDLDSISSLSRTSTSAEEKDSSTRGLVHNVKYMFKEGDDLRQDQLVLQLIILMDSILKKYGLDLRLTGYKVIACIKGRINPFSWALVWGTMDGFIEFVNDSQNLSQVLAENHNDLWAYFKSISPAAMSKVAGKKEGGEAAGGSSAGAASVSPEILDNFVRSCAGYCVITYILGIGDRHLDNLMINTKTGQMFHIDFGFILGKDPKPFPPPMKLCREMVEGMGGKDSNGYQSFLSNACEAFKILRRHQNLVVNLLYLMSDAGIKDISQFALSKLQEKFLPEMKDEEAEAHFITLINESVNALFPQVLEKLHKWAVYWR